MGPFETARLRLRKFEVEDFDAIYRLIRYAFEDLRLPRLVGGAMLDNERSVGLHRRLGYRLERNPDPNDPVGWITILENGRQHADRGDWRG